MCNTRIPRGAGYERIEVADMGTIVSTLVCGDCDECAQLCMDDVELWDEGATAEDILDWAQHSSHEAAARYLKRIGSVE